MLLAWVLTNVCTHPPINLLAHFLKFLHSRVFSQLLSCTRQCFFNLLKKAPDIKLVFYRSTNAKASTGSGGANSAVNGYMAFLLYSVAILACESLNCLASKQKSGFNFCLLVVRFLGSTTYMIVRLFAGE